LSSLVYASMKGIIFFRKVLFDSLFFLILLNLSLLFPWIGIKVFTFIATYCLERIFFSYSCSVILIISLISDAFYYEMLGTNFSICLFIVYCCSDLRIEKKNLYFNENWNMQKTYMCFMFFIVIWTGIFYFFNYKLIDIRYIIGVISSMFIFPLFGITYGRYYRVRDEQNT